MSSKKMNCSDGNYQCGGKCQSRRFKCPSEASGDTQKDLDKFQAILAREKPRIINSLKLLNLGPAAEENRQNFIREIGRNPQRFSAKLLNKNFERGLPIRTAIDVIDNIPAAVSTKPEAEKIGQDLKYLVDMKNPINGKLIGSGVQGDAYLVELGGENFVVKEGEISFAEIEILNSLRDNEVAGVVKALEVGEAIKDGTESLAPRRMVMSQAKGKPIIAHPPKERKKIKESPEEIYKIVKEMHALDIAHKDLHLGNIFIDQNGEITLIDFGKAKAKAKPEDKYADMMKLAEQKFKNQNETEIISFMEKELNLEGDYEDLQDILYKLDIEDNSIKMDLSKLFENPELFAIFQAIYFKGY